MKRLPIRIRLALWYMVVFSLALGAFGVSAWILVRQRLYAEVAEQLDGRVSSVEHYMEAQKNTSSEHTSRELQEEYDAEDEGTWLQIRAEDGSWSYRSRSMALAIPSVDLPQNIASSGRSFTVRADDVRLRVIVKPILVNGRRYTVETAIPTNGLRHTLQSLRTVLLLLAPAFLLVAGFGSYCMSRRALSTVDEITRMARSIHDNNLDSRLPALHTHDELQRLSDTLNEMLSRIEAAFRRTRQFTADASHELRSPLSLIRTEAELALRRSRTEAEYRNAFTHILAESVRTTELIESLLTLARTDSGAEELTFHPLPCAAFLQQVAEEWQPLFEAAHLRFETDLFADETFVSADEATLRRLLIVLLDNARKYTQPGGVVLLRAVNGSERSVSISVEDNGVGIASEHLPHIFDRFYRADKARSRDRGGAGLGLSLAKWIATQHHTEITVESTPGSGSRFAFQLEKTLGDVPEMPPPHKAERIVGNV